MVRQHMTKCYDMVRIIVGIQRTGKMCEKAWRRREDSQKASFYCVQSPFSFMSSVTAVKLSNFQTHPSSCYCSNVKMVFPLHLASVNGDIYLIKGLKSKGYLKHEFFLFKSQISNCIVSANELSKLRSDNEELGGETGSLSTAQLGQEFWWLRASLPWKEYGFSFTLWLVVGRRINWTS